MKPPTVQIVGFNDSKHRKQVIALWQTVFGYEAAHNSPDVVIDKKLHSKDDLFFVAQKEERVVGTAMAGYDCHRGWIYSVAVHPDYRKQGIGSDLLFHAQSKLKDMGCLKVNLQILEENQAVKAFYLSNGYFVEERISMGKKLY